ncbi:tail fiber protein [Sphingobacterium sp. UT-1RO-CII-1]|uniref:phage tail protein n=1 Tax=Sphingobacterium sp. UT-1RO-CII-1 TaxID=2995225 RepID=UPI00227D33C0|nr:tail fiber protein [Sphingobacterium sp. UT-1RO-CII-1]MCY4780334.1 tail fiber protein [Sphingobacterium sp. UT-1RO-CII-1]
MEPFIGQIQLFGFNYAPRGWAFCHGQLLSINSNPVLFALLGTTYGGNGQSTFGLPDLRGRVAIGHGQSPGFSTYTLGEQGGAESVTLLPNQMPAHTHQLMVSNAAGTTDVANGNYLANGAVTIARGNTVPANLYSTSQGGQLNQAAVGVQGAGLPHENRQPYLVMNYCIALVGEYPSRN